MAFAAAMSCGPSMQAIHESNVRFEHCYRLDLDPAIAPSHRQACWREWTERYTYGQTGDRIAYALRRSREIPAGKVGLALQLDAGLPVTDAAAPPVPLPTNPHAPPPAVAPINRPPPPDAGAPPDATATAANVPLPAADCTGACQDQLQTCSSAPCGGDGGCARCERDYRSCMRRCFQ